MHSFRYTVRLDYAFTVDKTTAGIDNMNSCVTYYHLLIDQDLNLNALTIKGELTYYLIGEFPGWPMILISINSFPLPCVLPHGLKTPLP